MFQRDYWSMSDEKLEGLAKRYNIVAMSATANPDEVLDAEIYFDRDRVIESLVARDSALWAGRAVLISLLALVVSLIALIIPLVLK
jgi:hypothetical protein